MNFQDVLNAVNAGDTDYATAKKLGISRQRYSKYRNEKEFPKEELMVRMSEMTGIKIEKIYFSIMAKKCHIPEVAEQLSELATH
jgi:DNA-binding XRE family transcriptional regulator